MAIMVNRAVLAHRLFTGISRSHLARLVEELAVPWQAGIDGRRHAARGRVRKRAEGAGARHQLKGSLARALEAFLTQHGLALPTDQAQRLAAGRRRRRIDAIPLPLRPPVQAFAESMPRARECARKAGTLPRTDSTIETALAIVRDLARFLTGTRNKQDWALTDVHDVAASWRPCTRPVNVD